MRRALLLFAVTATGCLPTVTIGTDAQIICTSTKECPHGFECDVGAQRCLPPGATLDRTPPFLVDSTVGAPVIGAGESAEVVLTISETLATPPVVTYPRGADEVDVPVDGSDITWTAHVAPTSDDATGALDLSAALVDAAGNHNDVRVPVTLAFDLDPPAPIGVVVTIRANRETNPIFPGSPDAVRGDSGVDVNIDFAEPVATASLALTGPDGALGVAEGVIGPGHAHFVFAPSFAASSSDGAISLQLTATDTHDNTYDDDVTLLLAAPLLVDNTAPPPPVFASFARAPWGSVAGGPPTVGSGTATDALLVLLLPGGVDVVDGAVPPTIDRIFPGATGAFAFAVPLDVPGARAVAVDAAGNISAPASAAVTEVTASVLDPTSPHRVLARPVARGALVQRGDRFVDGDLRAGSTAITAAPFWLPITPAIADAMPGTPILAPDPVNDGVLAFSVGQTFLVRGAQIAHLNVPDLPLGSGSSMAYDERRGVVVLFAGHGPDQHSTNSLFEWDGEHWNPRFGNDASDATRPAPRVAAGMTFVPSFGGVVIVGGCGQDNLIGQAGCGGSIPGGTDVWLWDGTAFTALCSGAACNAGGGLPFPLRPGIGVDAAGRLITAGGTSIPGLGFGPGTPDVAAFVMDSATAGHWQPECGGPCADGLPLDAIPVARPSGVEFLGGCRAQAGQCLAAYDAANGFTPVPFTDSAGTAARPSFQQQVAVDVAGDVVEVLANDTVVRTAPGGARRQIAPAALTARCGGAALVDGADVVVVGGCGTCSIGPGDVDVTCDNPVAASDAVVDAGLDGATAAPSAVTAPLSDVVFTTTVSGRSVVATTTSDGSGNTGVAAFVFDGTAFTGTSTLFDVVDAPDLQPLALVADPANAARALLFTTTGGHAADRIDAVDEDGTITSLCASSCGTDVSPAATSAGGGSIGLIAGGYSGESAVDPRTATVAGAVVTSLGILDPHPQSRALAGAAYDAGRGVAWLFAGTTEFPRRTGNDVFACGLGQPGDCQDVWAFDGAAWTPINTVDVFGAGAPSPRVRPAMTVLGDDVIVAGGGVGSMPFWDGATDAWRLVSGAAELNPAHLFQLELSAMGSDGASAPSAIDVLWCGTVDPARGAAAVDTVDVAVWTPGGFVPLVADAAAPVPAGCVKATTTPATSLAFAGRTPDRIVTVQVAAHPARFTGAAFTTVTTTTLEATARFVR